MRGLFLLAVLLAPLAAAAQEGEAPSEEQRWALDVMEAVSAAELRAAAAEAEARGESDPLLELARRRGVEAPEWLRERVAAQGGAATLAGLGNSLTAATAACSFPYYFCPARSWSAGDAPGSVKRRLAEDSGREVRGLTVAIPGVTSAALPFQAFVVFLASAFGLDVQRLTLEIGHNDPGVCSEPAEGSDAAFEEDLAATLRILGRVARRRQARLFVASTIELPALARYAAVTPEGAGRTCREIWADKPTCRRVVRHFDDAARMREVSARIASYGAVLRRLSAERDWVLYTETFNELSRRGIPEPERHLSRFDCFHPSKDGHSLIARAAWEGGDGLPGIADFFRLPPRPPMTPSAPLTLGQLEGWRSP